MKNWLEAMERSYRDLTRFEQANRSKTFASMTDTIAKHLPEFFAIAQIINLFP